MIRRVQINGAQPTPPPDTACVSQIVIGVASNASGQMHVAGVTAQVILAASQPRGLQPLGQSQLNLQHEQLTDEDQQMLESLIYWVIDKYIAAQGGAIEREPPF